MRQQAKGDITRVRVEGAQGIVVFHAPGATLYVFKLERESGIWKAATVAPSVLVPEPALPERG